MKEDYRRPAAARSAIVNLAGSKIDISPAYLSQPERPDLAEIDIVLSDLYNTRRMSDMLLVNTNEMPWTSGLEVVAKMTPEFGRNLGPADEVKRAYQKFKQKILRLDPDTTQRLDLIQIDAGYADLTDAYHDSVEECLFLSGDCDLSGEGHFVGDDYFWRPPGWVHSARTKDGFEALLLLQGVSSGDGSGPVSRRIRPASEAGTNALTSDLDQAIGPRGWVRRLHTRLVAWQPGSAYARGQGPLDLFDTGHIAVKILSSNPVTGSQSILLRLDPGYRQGRAGRHSAATEFFVLDGSLSIGDCDLDKRCYCYRPPHDVEAPMTSASGATLFMKVNGWLDFEGSA